MDFQTTILSRFDMMFLVKVQLLDFQLSLQFFGNQHAVFRSTSLNKLQRNKHVVFRCVSVFLDLVASAAKRSAICFRMFEIRSETTNWPSIWFHFTVVLKPRSHIASPHDQLVLCPFKVGRNLFRLSGTRSTRCHFQRRIFGSTELSSYVLSLDVRSAV